MKFYIKLFRRPPQHHMESVEIYYASSVVCRKYPSATIPEFTIFFSEKEEYDEKRNANIRPHKEITFTDDHMSYHAIEIYNSVNNQLIESFTIKNPTPEEDLLFSVNEDSLYQTRPEEVAPLSVKLQEQQELLKEEVVHIKNTIGEARHIKQDKAYIKKAISAAAWLDFDIETKGIYKVKLLTINERRQSGNYYEISIPKSEQ